jgi:ABC-type spermidine/putrescine transport system permease subunit II
MDMNSKDADLALQIGRWQHFPLVYAAVLTGVLASFILIVILPGAGQSNTVIGQLVSEPLWIPEIVAGVFFGRFFSSYTPPERLFLYGARQSFF